jgi:exoribonuclease-2
MLDAAFCRDACSLVPAQRRPALLLRLRIDAAGDAVTEAVDLAWVRVAESWTYDDAGRALDDGSAPPWLAAAAEAAQRSETARIARGAYLLYRPDVELRAPPFATPTLRPAPQAALARRVVSEAMVRAGIAVAGWLDVRGLPAPFRGHTAVRPPPLPPGCYTDPADVGAVLRSMGPARVQARSLRHDILGAAAYVQAGSPLRRYGDLLVQHQVLAAMRQRPTPFDAGPLLEALSASEERRRAMRRLERRGRRYFQLLHLAGHGLGTTLRGQVLAGNGRLPPRAQVPELGLEIELPSYAGGEGEWVRLVVDAIDPMRGRIDVHIAG